MIFTFNSTTSSILSSLIDVEDQPGVLPLFLQFHWSAHFEMNNPVAALRSAHTIIPICLPKHFKYFCKVLLSLRQNFKQARCSSSFRFHYVKKFTFFTYTKVVRACINFSCCSDNRNNSKKKQNIGWCFWMLLLASATC